MVAEAGRESERTRLELAVRRPRPTSDDPGPVASAARARISIGPQTVGDAPNRYAIRTETAENAVIVAFASSPPVGGHPNGALPAHFPVTGRLTSGFGWRADPLHASDRFHAGVDLAAPAGSPILATSDGSVVSAGWSGGYGIMVALDHGNGVETRYAHMSGLAVAAGQAVRQGDVIGFVGSTGRSSGPHVHYEVRIGGRAVDPVRVRQTGRSPLE